MVWLQAALEAFQDERQAELDILSERHQETLDAITSAHGAALDAARNHGVRRPGLDPTDEVDQGHVFLWKHDYQNIVLCGVQYRQNSDWSVTLDQRD